MLEIEIDGKKINTPPGGTIMDAATQVGIYIPHFCYHKKLSIAANCRMCLVQVEKAAKPLPACATPVTDGMKVMTRSEYAIKAQKGVMEFLLINHPLDCPICDQGGECSLQDLAVGYGGSQARYQEVKRVVTEKDLGPLVATDMTRCIYCTRCVRFGQEIAGIMEMGQIGRGEHSEIMPFISRTIDSELSGNIIDLCPVGALTSKPFRYTARSWELSRRRSVSPHDGLGSNLVVQVKNGRVMRVLPLENEAINECWLPDRDRFSYEGLNSPERLTRPMIKQDGVWREVDWQVALEAAANGIKDIRQHGENPLGGLASPHQTLEELYLFQKLLRGLGSRAVDTRPRQADFSRDGAQRGALWLGMPIADLNRLDRVLLIGSRLRQEQPLIAHRLRVAVRHGAHFMLINPIDDELLMPVTHKAIVPPQAMVQHLAEVLFALAAKSGKAVSEGLVAGLSGIEPDSVAQAMAEELMSGERKAVLLGNLALHHPAWGDIHTLALAIAQMSGATLGILSEAANSVGAWVAGAVPSGQGDMSFADMVDSPRKAYLVLGLEPELDSHDPAKTLAALKKAGLVIGLAAWKPAQADWADILLPITPFSETAGTFVNMEGRVQSFHGAAMPLQEARPAWKVLRVLGTMLGLSDFEYDDVDSVRRALLPTGGLSEGTLNNELSVIRFDGVVMSEGLTRVGDVPPYRTDALVRRAEVLQRTDGVFALAHPDVLAGMGIVSGAQVRVRQNDAVCDVVLTADTRLAPHCVRVAAGVVEHAGLGAMMGAISVERAS